MFPHMSSESGSAPSLGSPNVFRLCVGLSVFGAAQPLLALARGAGGSQRSGAALMMLVLWGVLPFVLPPVAARIARRPFSRGLAVTLTVIAAALGFLGHFAGMVPKVPNATDSLAFIFIPVWQWPMLLLATVVARVAPAPAVPERAVAPE
jgi:hypothetical protein